VFQEPPLLPGSPEFLAGDCCIGEFLREFPNEILPEMGNEPFPYGVGHKSSSGKWKCDLGMVREVGQKKKKGNTPSTPRRYNPPSLKRE
jgi:hypothetical protein